MTGEFKSPRKVEEEIKEYRRNRFEAYMQMADDGVMERALAIAAFRDEDSYLLWVAEEEQTANG